MTSSTAPGGAVRQPSEWICDAFCVGFALWTVACHLTVARGGGLRDAVWLSGAAALASGLAWWLSRGRSPRDAAGGLPPEASASRPPPPGWLELGAFVAALAAVGLWLPRSVVALWWAGLALLLLAAVWVLLRQPGRPEPPVSGRSAEAALFGIAALCALLALLAHRPDVDDAFYVNVAVAAADAPRAALLAGDTLLGVEGLPLHQPAHRVHTWELWNGAISWLTGMPAILCFHWLSAALGAFLLPLAHARLLRLLVPRVWLFGVAALVVVLLASGEPHRWYGNFALVRAWQGKSLMLFVLLPLVQAYAIAFALRPGWRRFGLLIAAQTAAVGASSTAIWAAPLAALVALAALLRPSRRDLGILLWGGLASAYPFAVGLWLRGQMLPTLAPMLRAEGAGVQLERSLHAVLGDGRLEAVALAATLAAWCCLRRGLAQRFAIAAPLVVWALLLSPYGSHWVGANVTGASHWRALWALPVPLLLALVVVAPLDWSAAARHRRWRRAGALASVALLAALVGVPRYGALSARNQAAGVGLWLGRPGPKVPPTAYGWAEALHESVSPGATVVAPLDIGVWLPTFHRPAHPLVVRREYLLRFQEQLGADELRRRQLVTAFSAGQPVAPELFRSALERYDVEGVCLRKAEGLEQARAILRSAGFERAREGAEHEIWVRS